MQTCCAAASCPAICIRNAAYHCLIAQRLARAAVNRVAVQALQLVVPRLGLLQAVGGLAQQQIVRRTVEIQRGAVCYPRNVFPEIPPFSA